MASPIFTFQDEHNNNRFLFFWDPSSKLPETIPMNLLTFLQYLGINNEGKISDLYSQYPRLIASGTSIADFSFELLPEYIKQLCFDFVKLQSDLPNLQENELNLKLEKLLTSDLSFPEFYSSYKQITKKLNHTPKRPFNYYLSWKRTSEIFNTSGTEVQHILDNLSIEYSVKTQEVNFNLIDIHSCLKTNVFNRFPKLMAECFLELGKRNFITLDAIPHVLRNNKAIQKLFNQLGMASYLPYNKLEYDFFLENETVYKELNDISHFRHFFNLYTFEEKCNELLGTNLLEKDVEELTDLLAAHNCYIQKIVNFHDQKGNYLLPTIYSNHHVLGHFDKFFFLAPFDKQEYHIVNKKGKVIDKSGYWDFYQISEDIYYVQDVKTLSWFRWSYNDATETINKTPVNVDNPYDENAWKTAEKQFKGSVSENIKRNQKETYEILELEFGKQDDIYCLFLSIPNHEISTTIKRTIIESLNNLIKKGINVSDPYTAAFELYKELLKNNSQIKFSIPNLHYFIVEGDFSVNTSFYKNYRNNDFFTSINSNIVKNRPILSHLSLELSQYRGHYTENYKFHFQMSTSEEVFQQDCEDFFEKKPFISEGDLKAYSDEFLNYLLGKKYKQVKAFNIFINQNSITELLGRELNAQTRFDILQQPANPNENNEDDLPI